MKEKNIFLRKNKKILNTELWVILNALNIVGKKILNIKDILITIFCNLQKALRAIEYSPYHKKNQFLKGLIYKKTEKLKNNGYYVTIW